jgi:hypothetical protein
MSHVLLLTQSGIDHDFVSVVKKVYSFCLMVEASDHGYVLHTRRYMSHGTEYDTISD